MNIFKTLIIFVAALFLGTTILTTAKEVEEVDYPSLNQSQIRKNSLITTKLMDHHQFLQ